MYFGKPTTGNFRRPRIKDLRHLKVIRQLPSVISGQYPCEACHIRYSDKRFTKRETGMAERPDDRWTLPMTRDEHISQHMMNELEFWESKNIDATALAWVLYGIWAKNDIKSPAFAADIMKRILAGMPR